ncbi:MAG: YdcF family protein [Gallionella sp.]|nr:YdcF family protein [Gallionella sp.]
MSWYLTNLIATLLMPPLSLLLLLALGIVLLYRRHNFARPMIIVSLCLLWIVSTPYFAEGALHILEDETVALDSSEQKADVIVILGGGTYFKAPEYSGQDTIGGATLERLRYGAKLQRDTGRPILVTGGKPLGNSLSEAQQMRVTLEQEFRVPVRWTEEASDNTFENAHHSFRILQQEGLRNIYLVTHGWHMARSADIFRRAGFEVVEAPTSFTTRYRIDLLAFLPRAAAMHQSKLFLHELIGLFWYRLKLTLSGN